MVLRSPSVHRVNLSRELKAPTLLGDILGGKARSLIWGKILSSAEEAVWHIDLVPSAAVDYKFLGHCLPAVMDMARDAANGKAQAFAVRCDLLVDRETVLQGVAWTEGNVEPMPSEEAVERICEDRREFVLVGKNESAEGVSFEYVGTSERKFLDLLSHLDEEGPADLDGLRDALGWPSQKVHEVTDKLLERRHLLMMAPKENKAEARFFSTSWLIRQKEGQR